MVGPLKEPIKPFCREQLEVAVKTIPTHPTASGIEFQLILFASQSTMCFSWLLICMCKETGIHPAVKVHYILYFQYILIYINRKCRHPRITILMEKIFKCIFSHMHICKSIFFEGFSSMPLLVFAFPSHLSLICFLCWCFHRPLPSCPSV